MKKSESEKEYWRGHGYSLGYLDENNFYVARVCVMGAESKRSGEEVLRDVHYFGKIEGAIEWLARQLPKRDARDIGDYVRGVKKSVDKLISAVEGAMGVNIEVK